MTKAILTAKVAEKTSASNAEATRCVNAVLESIVEILKEESKLALVGFGTFQVKQRAERTGRNPHTGAVLVIPAKKAVTFKVSKSVTEGLN